MTQHGLEKISLEKLLQSQGFGSRKLCRSMIENGRVSVNGAPCDAPAQVFATEGLQFSVDGQPWRYQQQVYLAMNKPAGVECSHQPQHHASVFSLLPPQLVARGVQCVGRLDADTTGLLLLSDDGAFIHTYSAPRKKVPKIYQVTLKHPLQPAMTDALLNGVQLHDEPGLIAAVACEAVSDHVLNLTIAEGKYHQVKRMIAAAGNRVEGLHRIAIGGLMLSDILQAGDYASLGASELAKLSQNGGV